MTHYRIECEECENTTFVQTYEKPEFCPVCGRRAEVEKHRDDTIWDIEDDE